MTTRVPRVIKTYYVHPNRDRQYDASLRTHLASTWQQPGHTHSQIARALGLGDPRTDKSYGMAIMFALRAFVAEDDTTVCWHPHLRLKEADLQAKLAQSKYAGYDLTVYKHAPYRKIIDRDPSRQDEVVAGVIVGYLRAEEAGSGNQVVAALKTKLGHVSTGVVRRCLEALVKSGDVVAEKTRRDNATIYSLIAFVPAESSVDSEPNSGGVIG